MQGKGVVIVVRVKGFISIKFYGEYCCIVAFDCIVLCINAFGWVSVGSVVAYLPYW